LASAVLLPNLTTAELLLLLLASVLLDFIPHLLPGLLVVVVALFTPLLLLLMLLLLLHPLVAALRHCVWRLPPLKDHRPLRLLLLLLCTGGAPSVIYPACKALLRTRLSTL
jgi:hypothetical protein